MKSFNVTIQDPLGIHARPAGILARAAKALEPAVVFVTAGPKTVKAVQLMKVMGLGVRKGDTVSVSVEGGDEENALDVMKRFFIENFCGTI